MRAHEYRLVEERLQRLLDAIAYPSQDGDPLRSTFGFDRHLGEIVTVEHRMHDVGLV